MESVTNVIGLIESMLAVVRIIFAMRKIAMEIELVQISIKLKFELAKNLLKKVCPTMISAPDCRSKMSTAACR